MDLESDLRRVLSERGTSLATEDPVPGIHLGMRRRRRRQRLQQLGAALSVTAVALAGGLVLGHEPAPTDHDTLASRVPAGFEASDLTFLSTSRGYALGSTPCGASRCTVVLRTENGATDWERVRAPQAGVASGNEPDSERCDLTTCVTQLRFAPADDGETVGYAFGPDFAVTRDDAQTWVVEPASGRVQAVEAAQGGVVRVVLVGSEHIVERSDVGGSEWTEVLRFTSAGRDAQLRRQGARLVLTAFGRGTAELRTSDDGGATWSTGARDLCGPDGSFVSAALGKAHQVVALCTEGGSYGAFVRESLDDGATFGTPLPVTGLVAEGRQLVALPSRWVVAAGGGSRELHSTTDEGRTWTADVKDPAAPLHPVAAGYLDNSNSDTVWWVGADGRRVWRTQDGGETWTSTRFG